MSDVATALGYKKAQNAKKKFWYKDAISGIIANGKNDCRLVNPSVLSNENRMLMAFIAKKSSIAISVKLSSLSDSFVADFEAIMPHIVHVNSAIILHHW